MTSTFGQIATTLAKNGFEPVPIIRGEKRPAPKGWESGGWHEHADKFQDNYTGLLTRNNPSVDIDVSDPELVQKIRAIVYEVTGCYEKLPARRIGNAPRELLLFRTEEPFQKIQTAGYRLQTDKPGPDGKIKASKVEILADGQQFVAYAIHPDTNKPYVWNGGGEPLDIDASQVPVLDEYQAREIIVRCESLLASFGELTERSAMDKGILSIRKPSESQQAGNPKIVSSALAGMPNPNLCFDDWIRVLYAAKGGLGDAGYESFMSWSKKSSKHDDAFAEKEWHKAKPTTIGAGSIMYMARALAPESAFQVIQSPAVTSDVGKFQDVVERINECADLHELTHDIPSWIVDQRGLDELSIFNIAGILQKAIRKLGGNVPIASLRQMLQTKEIQSQKIVQKQQKQQQDLEIDSVREMMFDWVYETKHNIFTNLVDGRQIDSKAFNLEYAGAAPEIGYGEGKTAPTIKFAEEGGVTVYHSMYVPQMWRDTPDGRFFKYEGVSYLNSYMGHKVPKEAKDWADRNYWKVFHDHLMGLLETKEEAVLFIKWLAHNIQNPGLRIKWMSVIVGPEGAGKTAIFEALGKVMGNNNVKVVGVNEIHSQFTGWAEGSCIAVIEEIRVHGTSRHDVMNQMKQFITNDRINIVRKGRDGVDSLNTQNYLAFTNHSDALAITEGDRRYGVFQTKAKTREEIELCYGKDYWDSLFDAIRNGSDDIRGWLMSIDLSDFDRNAAPPMTSGKRSMISSTRSEDETNVEHVIFEENIGTCVNAVSTSHVNLALRNAGFKPLSTNRINKVLKNLGYVNIKSPIKFDGKTCRFMVKQSWLASIGLDVERDQQKINEHIKSMIKAPTPIDW